MRLGRPERRDSLELRVCVVCLEKMERRAPLDPLDLLVLQEREESRVNQDHQASRVCPDPPVPRVKEGNPVIRVFQEKVEPQGPLDPEVSVVSQEREEVRGHRASRGLEVYQELQEPTDPRVASVLEELLELRGLRDYRGCLEREGPLGFPDQRGTEVIMVRKDLKELLGKTAQEV